MSVFSVCDVIFFSSLYRLAGKGESKKYFSQWFRGIFSYHWMVEWVSFTKTNVAGINLTQNGFVTQQCASWMLVVSQMCCLQLFEWILSMSVLLPWWFLALMLLATPFSKNPKYLPYLKKKKSFVFFKGFWGGGCTFEMTYSFL